MDVEIREVVTTVSAIENTALASPEVLHQIVKMVLRAIRDREEHAARVLAERRVTGGVSQERDAEF